MRTRSLHLLRSVTWIVIGLGIVLIVVNGCLGKWVSVLVLLAGMSAASLSLILMTSVIGENQREQSQLGVLRGAGGIIVTCFGTAIMCVVLVASGGIPN